jgi:hypothetical protein
MKEFHVLNLGAGVQSTTVYLMVHAGELEIPLDCAVFADTQEEPRAVYKHLDWLRSLGTPPIHVRTAGPLGEHLKSGTNSTGGRFASIPAFTAFREGEPTGLTRRQCTKEYKVQVIERFIRYELLGLQPRQRIPGHVTVHHYFGFSWDEAGRAARARMRFAQQRWGVPHFPLIDEQMTRGDCLRWLDKYGLPHEVPRSACVCCPYKSNAEWRHLRDHDPDGWARAVEIDEALRRPGSVVNRGMDARLYVHRSCVPLQQANLHDDQRTLFDMECEGGCGL